jgi:uncharacterized protein (TIGR02271 family)
MPDQTGIAERFEGYELIDADGQKVGSVHSLWLDTATNEPEFVAVKSGMLGRTHIVPVAGAQIDGSSRQLRVPYRRDQIGAAPHIDETAELSEQEEEQVYRHYGVQRSEAPSPTGLAGGGTSGQGQPRQTTETTGGTVSDRGTAERRRERIQLREERPVVQTQQEQAGEVRVGTHVTEREETVEVPVREERVVIERTPVQGEARGGEITGRDETIDVPVMRERADVEKETVVTEEVNVRTEATERQEQVQTTLRKEELDVQGDEGVVTDQQRAGRTDESAREQRRG